ncbi:MAG: hypothetical protein MAG451_03027 [Anaerolineales bacterium]|nr:hypothetical protein [Anaerolineales bacterium]
MARNRVLAVQEAHFDTADAYSVCFLHGQHASIRSLLSMLAAIIRIAGICYRNLTSGGSVVTIDNR